LRQQNLYVQAASSSVARKALPYGVTEAGNDVSLVDVAPQLEATFLDLFHSVANLLGLGGGQHVVGIDQFFRFNEHAVILLGEVKATKSPSRSSRVSQISRGITT
jgi:hypothetical protein